MSNFVDQHTPSISIIDPRGLMVRTIAFHRREAEEPINARVQRQVFNANGHLSQQWDSRLLELSKIIPMTEPNQSRFCSLSGQPLLTENVDSGWGLVCNNEAGLLHDSWDGRGTHRRYAYDELSRPIGVFEHEPSLCVEVFSYAGSDEGDADYNRCGRLIRHDDQAGRVSHEAFGLTGQLHTETRRFCALLSPPAWPESELHLQDATYISHWRHDALGAVIEQIDALGHIHRFKVDVAGQPFTCSLDDVPLLKSTTYNAFGQTEVEQAGNDVTTTAYHSAPDGLLSNLKVQTPTGKTLQDLQYLYDPVGNIRRVEDLAQPAQWYAQQRIQAVSTYTYDTLYQLISATGRENVSQTIGPGLPGLEIFGAIDDSRWRTYTQNYTYDSGGNLTLLKHDAGAGNTTTREMVVDLRSNRSLFKDGSPIDFANGFDANGNQQALADGQLMRWDTRNHLQQVTQVQRDDPDGQDDDVETYVYDGAGQRVRKVRRAKTLRGEQVSEALYLPGLEIRSRTNGEKMHVVIARAGRNGVRFLHWENGRRKGIANDQLRYSLSDHLYNSVLELDQDAQLLSQESYYPYGGTAWWAARATLDAEYKTVRYSGKERDASGLYYYGFRYYAPWLQRWINPDPAGDSDGLNLFRMVRNNPVTLLDTDGRMPMGTSNGNTANKPNTPGQYASDPSDQAAAYTLSADNDPQSLATAAVVEDRTSASPVDDKPRRSRSNSVRALNNVYRYDTRSPGVIMKNGFEGTDSDDHLFARYGSQTVFTSTLREGADIFRKSFEKAMTRKTPLFLYRIKLGDISYFDFYREYTVKGNKAIKEIASLKFEQNFSKFTAMTKFRKLGRQGFEQYLQDKLSAPIVEAFVGVNELHVEGPVQPQEIFPLMPPRLEYLDLAISNTNRQPILGRLTAGYLCSH